MLTVARHIAHIFDALEVGLGEGDRLAAYDLPRFPKHFDLEPCKAFGTVVIDDEHYIVTVKKAEAGDPMRAGIDYDVNDDPCPKSTHGRHTWSNNVCIGCGKVDNDD